MENIEKLVYLIFKEYIKSTDNYSSYQEIDILCASVKKYEDEKNNPDKWYSSRDNFEPLYDLDKSLDELTKSGYIGYVVRIGGNSGGNCWGGESSYEAEDEINLDNDYLDKILEIIAPDVTYLTYRKIEKEIIIKSQYTKHEYYGNNDVYQVKMLSVKNLLTILSDKKNLISEDQAFLMINHLESELKPKKNKL